MRIIFKNKKMKKIKKNKNRNTKKGMVGEIEKKKSSIEFKKIVK